jgi:hypothetical protein
MPSAHARFLICLDEGHCRTGKNDPFIFKKIYLVLNPSPDVFDKLGFIKE